MSTIPTRIQRSRKAGSSTPANTKYCGRPGKWGNPFVVYQITHTPDYFRVVVNVPDDQPMKKALCVQILIKNGRLFFASKEQAQAHAARLFGCLILEAPEAYPVHELAKYARLSCWCKVDEPCHVDEILKWLNHLPGAGKTISE